MPVRQIDILCKPHSCSLSHIIPSLEQPAQLVGQSIDAIIDIETKGAGHCKSKMREDSKSLHPGRPRYFLEYGIIISNLGKDATGYSSRCVKNDIHLLHTYHIYG